MSRATATGSRASSTSSCKMGFAGYFLIVADFIRWAREQRDARRPGPRLRRRLACRLRLGITDLDPLAHDLLFERFLNPERVSMPDFDIDFCMEGRDRVIDYVSGRSTGASASRRSSPTARWPRRPWCATSAACSACATATSIAIAKLIPFELGITLDDALAKEPELKRRLREGRRGPRSSSTRALRSKGSTRNAGTHAGGVVIAPSVLTDFAPLYCDARPAMRRHAVRQGRRRADRASSSSTSSACARSRSSTERVAAINRDRAKRGEAPLDIDAIPMDDAKTYDLLKALQARRRCSSSNRSGMKDLIRACSPTASRTSSRSSRCSARAAAVGHGRRTSSIASTASERGRSTTCIRS